jgi:cobalt/nickel transport system permease protein
MANIQTTLYKMRLLDDLAQKETFIQRVHPLFKLLTTVVYLTVVVSLGRDEIGRLLPFLFYPILIFALAEIPVVPILKRVSLVIPFVIGIGILNPVFDQHTIFFFGMTISRGWFTFVSIIIKSGLTVLASILLIATTGIDQLAAALRMLRVPKIFVLQLILTYRYISVLVEELSRMMMAYSMRAPEQKGIHPRVWGSFAGQLLLRTFDRAQRVYQSMNLRGFTGEYHTGKPTKVCLKDVFYFVGWSSFFILARMVHIPNLIGAFLTGG